MHQPVFLLAGIEGTKTILAKPSPNTESIFSLDLGQVQFCARPLYRLTEILAFIRTWRSSEILVTGVSAAEPHCVLCN